MSDQDRWSEDLYGDRYDTRTHENRRRDPYGRDFGQDRYSDRGYGAGRSGNGESSYALRPGGGNHGYEAPSFSMGERGYDPYGSTYGDYGEEVYRERRYGADPRDLRQHDSPQASGAMLHQGYRAPFAGVRGDPRDYRNAAYGQDSDTTRYQYNDYRVDRNRDGAGFGARDFAAQGRRGLWDQTRDEVSSWFGDDQAAHRRQMDDERHNLNHHRGRGPKGYTRSDDRIREDVNDRLTDDHRLDASGIEAKVSNGEVTLSGHVESRQAKRRAEDIADGVAGVKHVQNNLRVQEHPSSASFDASAGAAGQIAAGQSAAGQAATKSN